MPGPISDSYDPEFGTGANAQDVRDAILMVREQITNVLGPALKNIVDIAHGNQGHLQPLTFTEKEARVIRFCLDRALESI